MLQLKMRRRRGAESHVLTTVPKSVQVETAQKAIIIFAAPSIVRLSQWALGSVKVVTRVRAATQALGFIHWNAAEPKKVIGFPFFASELVLPNPVDVAIFHAKKRR